VVNSVCSVSLSPSRFGCDPPSFAVHDPTSFYHVLDSGEVAWVPSVATPSRPSGQNAESVTVDPSPFFDARTLIGDVSAGPHLIPVLLRSFTKVRNPLESDNFLA